MFQEHPLIARAKMWPMAECRCLALKLGSVSHWALGSVGSDTVTTLAWVSVTSNWGSQLPLKKHHSTAAILTIHSLRSIWRDLESLDESVCSSCFFPRHGYWLGVKEENCANLPSLPCTHQTHVSSQTPCRQDHNGPKRFMDEARNAFPALTG